VVGWKEVRNYLPFGILEIGWVGLVEFSHSPILPNYLRNTLLGNLLAGFVDIGLGTLVGIFLVDTLVRQDRQEKWSKSRNYILGAVAVHLSDFAFEALIAMPINDHRPMNAIIDGRSSPNPATVIAIRKIASLLRDIRESPSFDKSLSDYVFELYDNTKWDLDQIQTVLTPWIIQSEADQELIDAMMVFDRARRQLHNAIIGDKLMSKGAAYPTPIEFIDVVADLYIVLSKYWKPISEKT
jgi:hypothetical protein